MPATCSCEQFYAVFYQLKSRLCILINVLKFLTSPSNPFFRQVRVEGYGRAIEPELAAHFRKKKILVDPSCLSKLISSKAMVGLSAGHYTMVHYDKNVSV